MPRKNKLVEAAHEAVCARPIITDPRFEVWIPIICGRQGQEFVGPPAENRAPHEVGAGGYCWTGCGGAVVAGRTSAPRDCSCSPPLAPPECCLVSRGVYPPRIRGLEKNGKGLFVSLFGERA
jgi:hypothetical protein